MQFIKDKNKWIVVLDWSNIHRDIYDFEDYAVKNLEYKRPYKTHILFEHPMKQKDFGSALNVAMILSSITTMFPFYLNRKCGCKVIIHHKNDEMASLIRIFSEVEGIKVQSLDDNSVIIGSREFYISRKGKLRIEPVIVKVNKK